MEKNNRSLALALIAPLFALASTGCLEIFDYLPEDLFPGSPDDCDSHGVATAGTTGFGTHTNWTTETNTRDSSGTGVECANPADPNAPVEIISGDLTGQISWTCDKIYVLERDTQVEVDNGTLHIAPGTTIKGKFGSALIIEKNAQLHAVGTPGKPIVFTSSKSRGNRRRGDWGGLVLLGKAITNQGVNVPAEGFSMLRTYGGTNPTHNCGTLRYVRVEWAGFALTTDNELNSITFYACGTDTKFDHVQSHMGLDDGFEWFGGGFDAHHLIATGAKDDSLDVDLGFNGKFQFIFIHQDPSLGDNGFEVSSNENNAAATPATNPRIANLTFIGSGADGQKSAGFTFKQGTNFGIYNSIAINTTWELFRLQSPETKDFMTADPSIADVRGSILDTAGSSTPLTRLSNDFGISPEAVEDWLADEDRGNHLRADAGLPSISWGYPYIKPAAGGLASTGAQPLPAGFAPANYIGAVDPAAEGNWTTESWVSYSVD